MICHSQGAHLIYFIPLENVCLLPYSSQNHRVTKSFQLERPQEVSNLTSGQLWAQTRLLRLLCLFWSWKPPGMEPAQPPSAACITGLSSKWKMFSYMFPAWNCPVSIHDHRLFFCRTRLIKSLTPSSWLPPLRYWKDAINSPWNFLHFWLKKTISLSLLLRREVLKAKCALRAPYAVAWHAHNHLRPDGAEIQVRGRYSSNFVSRGWLVNILGIYMPE